MLSQNNLFVKKKVQICQRGTESTKVKLVHAEVREDDIVEGQFEYAKSDNF